MSNASNGKPAGEGKVRVYPADGEVVGNRCCAVVVAVAVDPAAGVVVAVAAVVVVATGEANKVEFSVVLVVLLPTVVVDCNDEGLIGVLWLFLSSPPVWTVALLSLVLMVLAVVVLVVAVLLTISFVSALTSFVGSFILANGSLLENISWLLSTIAVVAVVGKDIRKKIIESVKEKGIDERNGSSINIMVVVGRTCWEDLW